MWALFGRGSLMHLGGLASNDKLCMGCHTGTPIIVPGSRFDDEYLPVAIFQRPHAAVLRGTPYGAPIDLYALRRSYVRLCDDDPRFASLPSPTFDALLVRSLCDEWYPLFPFMLHMLLRRVYNFDRVAVLVSTSKNTYSSFHSLTTLAWTVQDELARETRRRIHCTLRVRLITVKFRLMN